MQTIVIHAETVREVTLVREFLEQHKITGRLLSEEDKEDIVLSRLMEETNYEDVIDTDTFLQKLQS